MRRLSADRFSARSVPLAPPDITTSGRIVRASCRRAKSPHHEHERFVKRGFAMPIVGTVKEIWRYPVKSMAGERVATGTLTTRGVVGDRGWAIKDEKAGEIRGAKKLPALMRCHAAYVS